MKSLEHKKSKWSASKYAFTCAVGILGAMALMAFIYSLNNSYEKMGTRYLNLLFLLIGFTIMVYSYAKNQTHMVNYLEAFKLALRAGVYFLLMFFPLMALTLQLDPADLLKLKIQEAFVTEYTPLQVLATLFVLMPAFIVASALLSAPVAAFAQSKNTKYGH